VGCMKLLTNNKTETEAIKSNYMPPSLLHTDTLHPQKERN